MIRKKITPGFVAKVLACLCITNAALASEVRLYNKSDYGKIMEITYQICETKSSCSSELFTTRIYGGNLTEISGRDNKILIIKSAIEFENNRIVAKSKNGKDMCEARFSFDSVLLFNDYGSDEIVCRLGT